MFITAHKTQLHVDHESQHKVIYPYVIEVKMETSFELAVTRKAF